MGRTADYTIQGFLYQFNRTLVAILDAADKAEITVEGVIEDIEVKHSGSIEATQCKYHEARTGFTLSAIFKPLLQMMIHFRDNPGSNINYVLFAHFPNTPTAPTISISDLDSACTSTDQTLKKYVENLNKNPVNKSAFLAKFRLELGPSYEGLAASISTKLELAGFKKNEIENLIYPNAIHLIGNLSIAHLEKDRRIERSEFISQLKKIRATAISHWTLALKNREEVLKARRIQLSQNLGKNSRLRNFFLRDAALEEFSNGIVMFIEDYLDKYHFKPSHNQAPTFILDTDDQVFSDISSRLFSKGIIAAEGMIGGKFDGVFFYRLPMTKKTADGVQREFSLRLIQRKNLSAELFAKNKPADLFILGKGDVSEFDTQDINVESLETPSFTELRYLLGVNNVLK